MQSTTSNARQGISALAYAAVALSCLQLADAAPKVTRLTPPSALFSQNDPNPPIIARFLPGQRFDLQAPIGSIFPVTFLTFSFWKR